ncbi:hypothetical protein MtrunA17_Chr4g0069771 [Medicago truncatula]|uniref:Transmembrane protein n=1 Tax=Medicago truncatula TaxID=3880 RepID=A0A396IG33_MEDTR|nr:hypothetical protein MtrunA17_Chr4g0069771 [Medicago truncatula]
MFKTIAMLLLLLQLTSSFIAFAQELYSGHPAYPPHAPAPLHPPANAPHHHHHHHNPSPTPPPFPHTSLHPPTKSSVHPRANTPHHYHSSSSAPTNVHTPVHPHPTYKPPAHHHHHHHPPAHAPAVNTLVVPTNPPLHTIVPSKPPTPNHHHPPAPARVRTPVVPTHPQLHPTPCPRSFNVVQGIVHVKSCEYDGLNSLLGATKLLDYALFHY